MQKRQLPPQKRNAIIKKKAIKGEFFWGKVYNIEYPVQGGTYTAAWLASYDRRFKPYQAYFDAMELIDPTAPDSRVITPEVWDAVKHICEHFGLDLLKFRKSSASCIVMQRS